MSAKFSLAKNLASTGSEYSRHYGAFRGVDFSTDHTQINDSRLAYLVNMYKDYQSGQGEALETIAGFRRRVDLGARPMENSGIATFLTRSDANVNGIFYFKHKNGDAVEEKVLIHVGANLWQWYNYPNSINIKKVVSIAVPNTPVSTETINDITIKTYTQVIEVNASAVVSLKTESGATLTLNSYNNSTREITYKDLSANVVGGQRLNLTYVEGLISATDTPLIDTMANRKSKSFIFDNKLYIIDGKNYLVYDGTSISDVVTSAYIPTTWISLLPNGSTAEDTPEEHEQRNILSPKFKNTFIADGTNTEFSLTESNLDSIVSVTVNGTAVTEYTADLTTGVVTFTTAPSAPSEEGVDNVVIEASKVLTAIDGGLSNSTDIASLITHCTLCATFDQRVFLTGNPDYPNYVFYCERHDGKADASYFGILNHTQDGVGLAPITGIMGVADTLLVLKADTQQDSSIYYHSGQQGSNNIAPRIYPSAQGLSGLGCVGACCNFLDDPVFVSRLGIEGIGQLSVRLERAIEHRSRLVDAKLINGNMAETQLAEWGGYLCVLCGGKMFLADSRQRYNDSNGTMQYEWYYLDGIGVYDNQYAEYVYATVLPHELENVTVTERIDGVDVEIPIAIANNAYDAETREYRNLTGLRINNPDPVDGTETNAVSSKILDVVVDGNTYPIGVQYKIHTVYDSLTNEVTARYAYLAKSAGGYIGGVFKKAVILQSMADNLFFGTENGVICSFNFDKRNEFGEIPSESYNFDDRTIYSGCATLMDNCSVPHLTKTTTKRSTVIKTKTFMASAVKVKVRTNKEPYNQIARLNSGLFTFSDVDFTDFSFNTTEQSIFAIKEKEKQWVEKQYFIFSDEYAKPFALYSISYRYRIAGRIK